MNSAWIWLAPALMAGPAAWSAPQSPGVKAVLACREISDPALQLACFKTASDGLVDAPATPPRAARAAAAESPAPGSPSVETPSPRRHAFGARPPRPPKSARPSDQDRAELTLTSFSDPGDGRLVFHFSDGSTWRETVSESVAGSLKAGQNVTLERESLGSYVLDLPHRSSVKIFRERGE